MLAQLQRLLVLGILGCALVWGVALDATGRALYAALGGALILLSYVPLLGVEFLALVLVGGRQTRAAPPWAQVLRAWWGEILVVPAVFFWRQPFRSNAVGDSLERGATRGPGVVFVHGYVCNRGLWNPWMVELRRRGIAFVAVNLEPVFGSIDGHTDAIESAVQALEAATARPVVLVGHSMGGLVIRAWLHRFGAAARVHRIATIGTPHHGTWIARWALSPAGRQMRMDSPWLRALQDHDTGATAGLFTCFHSDCDNIVFPEPRATLAGAQNRHLPATGHLTLAYHRAVVAEVLGWWAP
jgi:pimeloyl-ACP methyl ester carboxylesterase